MISLKSCTSGRAFEDLYSIKTIKYSGKMNKETQHIPYDG